VQPESRIQQAGSGEAREELQEVQEAHEEEEVQPRGPRGSRQPNQVVPSRHLRTEPRLRN